MALKTFKPYTKSTRGTILVDRSGLWKGKPFKQLISPKNPIKGRNNNGHITSINRAGGHKKMYRHIDFYRKKKLTKNEKRLSIASLITEKNNLKNLHIFSDFTDEIKKTKEMYSIIKKFEIKNSLIILDKNSKNKIEKSIRNIPNIKVTDINHFSAFDIVKFKKIVFTESSIKELEKKYS